MAKSPTYNVPYRRRREGKTNFKLRKRLISSGIPRIVIRRTLKYIIIQLVKSTLNGDIVLTSAHSSELKKRYNWLGSNDNLPASYLTGLICGYRIHSLNIQRAVLDIGLQTPSAGSRVFAALKGLLDSGIQVPHKKEILPSIKKIRGEHIAEYAKMLSTDLETYSSFFSSYLSRNLPPENIPDHFQSVKEKVISELGT
jgi:large subunit ribosomal protein L18